MSLHSNGEMWMRNQHIRTSMTIQLKTIPTDSLIQKNSCASYLHPNWPISINWNGQSECFWCLYVDMGRCGCETSILWHPCLYSSKQAPSDSLIQNNSCASYLYLNWLISINWNGKSHCFWCLYVVMGSCGCKTSILGHPFLYSSKRILIDSLIQNYSCASHLHPIWPIHYDQ